MHEDIETSNGRGIGSAIAIAFVAGAVAGAVTTLLTAPRAGRETRREIKAIGHEVVAQAASLPAKVRSGYERVKSAAIEAGRHELDALDARPHA